MKSRFINKFIYWIKIIKNKGINTIYRILLIVIIFILRPLTTINILTHKELYNSIIIKSLLISKIMLSGFIILILIRVFIKRSSTI